MWLILEKRARGLCFMSLEYKLKSPVEDAVYYELLDFLMTVSKQFFLVKQSNFKFDKNAEAVLNNLLPYLIRKSDSNEWPGTKILDNRIAEVFYFKANQSSIKILKNYSGKLFDWLAPSLPEDIGFLRMDGSPIMVSIIHEDDYWLELNENERNILKEKFPDLEKELTKYFFNHS